MAAGEPNHIEWQIVLPGFGNRLLCKIERKCQVVARGNEAHWTLAQLWHARNERYRTNRRPVSAQLFKADIIGKARAQVASRQSAPRDIGDVTRNVIKRAGVDVRLVREGEKGDAGSHTSSQDADAFITLLLEPSHRGPGIEHCLAHRLDRAAHIRADQMIGAFEICWPAL